MVIVDSDGLITLVNRRRSGSSATAGTSSSDGPSRSSCPRPSGPGTRPGGGRIVGPRGPPDGRRPRTPGPARDGTEFPAEISLSPLQTADGLLVSAAIRDITDRKRADEQFRGLLEAAPDMVIVDADGLITLVNRQTERLFGYGRDELVGQPVEVLLPEAIRARHGVQRRAYSSAPEVRPMGAGLELLARRRDGTEFPAEISLSPLQTAHGLLVSAAIRDITDRKRAEVVLAHQALHDPLTGLPNRTLLGDRLAQALARAGRQAPWWPSSSSTSTGSSSSTTAWATPPATAAGGRGRTPPQPACGRPTPWPASAATSSSSWPTTTWTTTTARALAERVADGCSQPARPSTARDLVVTASIGIAVGSGGRHRRRACCATPTRRCTGPRSGPDRDRDVRRRPCAARGRGPPPDAERPAPGPATATSCGSHYQPIVDLDTGVVAGVEALVRWQPPRPGAARARRLHPGGRGHRAHRADRRRGCSSRRAAGRDWSGLGPAAPHRQRQPVGPPARAIPTLVADGRQRRCATPASAPDALCLEITESVPHATTPSGGRRVLET